MMVKSAFNEKAMIFPPLGSAPTKRSVVLYIGASLFLIFYLPHFFPVPVSGSDSYMFGYNNRVGIILFLLLCVIGAFWTRGLNLNLSSPQTSPKIPSKYLWGALSVEFAACATMYLFAGRYAGVGESAYNIHQVWLLSLGKFPYIDFEWTYGCAFLYGPLWFSRFFHLGIPQAYYLFWLIASMAGIALLFSTINLVDYPSNHRITLFILLSASAVLTVPSMGLSYTILRFDCPLWFVLLTYRTNQNDMRFGAPSRAPMLMVSFTAVLLTISPEIAIAHAFACLVILFPYKSVSSSRRFPYLYLAAAVALAGVFFLAARLHVFDGVRTAGSGSASFPIFVAPHILLYFTVVFISFCYIVQRLLHGEIQDNTVALLAFSVPMMTAALSRCDPGHVLLDGMGFFVAAFFYASKSRRLRRLYCAGYVFSFLTISAIFGIWLCIRPLLGSGPPEVPAAIDFHALYPGIDIYRSDSTFEAPYGYSPNTIASYLSTKIDEGYYDGLIDTGSTDSFLQKINELARNPQRNLLIPKDFSHVGEKNARTERIIMSLLFTSPYLGREKQNANPYKPLAEYILAHYSLAVPASPANFQYELWIPGNQQVLGQSCCASSGANEKFLCPKNPTIAVKPFMTAPAM